MGNRTRKVLVGDLVIGGGAPVSVQSMCATPTQDVGATIRQIKDLEEAGADIVRLAVDNISDARCLVKIAQATRARFCVDLQENFRLAELVAPHVDKLRYNPGHLHRLDKTMPIEEKVAWLVKIARKNGNALRVGVNCGSVAPDFLARYPNDRVKAIVECAVWHCALLDSLRFTNYVVSLKDSDPKKVVECNTQFSVRRPDVPIHLGVTEAGLEPEGVIKTRLALEPLLARGIGDTIRVSLTLPQAKKSQEIRVGRQILDDVEHGRFLSVPDFGKGLNIISCPSCARVQNEAFVELAQEVKKMTSYAKGYHLTIAVMGCRVNGPGETDDADLGLWCGPARVTLKQKATKVGSFRYNNVLPALRKKLDEVIAQRTSACPS